MQTERDTIEVIAFLKKEDAGKERELEDLQLKVKDIHMEAKREKDALLEKHYKEVTELEENLLEKEEEVCYA